MEFYGDPTLLLQLHVIENLVEFHLAGRIVPLRQKAVSNSRLAVVDMGNDAEITYVIHEVNLHKSIL